MDFDQTTYHEKITINGDQLQCMRSMKTGKILVPYTDAPDVGIGDMVFLQSGPREIQFRVVDTNFQPGGTLDVGTTHKNLLTLKVENLTAQPHISSHSNSIFNIGTVSGSQVQVGSGNSQVVSIDLKNLAEAIAKSDDGEAKMSLRNLLENSTVASIAGAGVTGLIALLSKQ